MERKLSEYISLSQTIDVTKSSKKIKVGILSSFTINGLGETLTVKCSELDIKCQSYVAGYIQAMEDKGLTNVEVEKISATTLSHTIK